MQKTEFKLSDLPAVNRHHKHYKKHVFVILIGFLLVISGLVLVLVSPITSSSQNTRNYFTQSYIKKLISRSNSYGMVSNIDVIDNRFYNPTNKPTDVDNDISDNNLWQYHKEPFISRFINVQSSIPMYTYQNNNSINSADYSITFPFPINDPIKGNKTCVLQFNGYDPFPLFNNNKLPPSHDFPETEDAVYYFDSNLDNASNSSVVRTKSSLSGMYIFLTPSYCYVYSFLTAYGGVHSNFSAQAYPNLYSQNNQPFQTQNYTSFVSFETKSGITNKFLIKLIQEYLKLKIFFSNSYGDYKYSDSSPTYVDERNLFYFFSNLFSFNSMTGLSGNTLSHFQSIQIETKNSPKLQPPTKTTSPPHNYEYQPINSVNSAIKSRTFTQTYTLKNITLPLEMKYTNRNFFYSRLYLANQNNYQTKNEPTNNWWQPYIINTVNKNGTGFLSDEFLLILQPPNRFNFRTGNTFDYNVSTYRSAAIHKQLVIFICLDIILIIVVLLLYFINIFIRRRSVWPSVITLQNKRNLKSS